MKVCTKGRDKLPATLEYFYRRPVANDGLDPACKVCKRKYQKQYQASDGIKSIEKQRAKKYYATINGYLRHTFSRMTRRCTNPDHWNYGRYGGRGIRVCFQSSSEFVNYVINILRIDPRGLQIDRIDNNGNYEPGNIRFVTNKENCQNRYYENRKVLT